MLGSHCFDLINYFLCTCRVFVAVDKYHHIIQMLNGRRHACKFLPHVDKLFIGVHHAQVLRGFFLPQLKVQRRFVAVAHFAFFATLNASIEGPREEGFALSVPNDMSVAVRR